MMDVEPFLEKTVFTEFIFQQLKEFLNHKTTDTNNLLNASNKLRILKKSDFYWKLNAEYSLDYYGNKGNFQSRIDSLLTNARTQLSLYFFRCSRALEH
jgi:N-glycosylase/DNA lyase